MGEIPQAVYVRDGFYIHDATVWPLDASDEWVEVAATLPKGG